MDPLPLSPSQEREIGDDVGARRRQDVGRLGQGNGPPPSRSQSGMGMILIMERGIRPGRPSEGSPVYNCHG